MPPKPPANSNKGGTKPSVRIKKPNISQNQKNSKLALNNKNRPRSMKQNQIENNEEVVKEEPQPIKRRESWLDKLPSVIKPDQELHIQLTKERKIKQKEKHTTICQKELFAMLNVAFYEIDHLNEVNNTSFIEKVKFDFFQTNRFHQNFDKIENSKEPLNQNNKDINSQTITDLSLLTQSVQKLFENVPNDQNSNDLSIESEPQFDSNPELNKLFQKINIEMQPYCTQTASNSLIEFPFLICVVGPPCTGKTTVTQFITSHFDVHTIIITNCESSSSSKLLFDETKNEDSISYINLSDDKAIISSIISIISEIPHTKGIIIENFPESKSQFSQLEKALQGNKKKNESKFQSISGFIRTSMTAEEAAKQVQNRLIDKSTNIIFHTNFNPPNSTPYSNDHPEPLLYSPETDLNTTFSELSQSYSKLQAQFQSLDNSIKKSKPCLFLEFCPYIGNLQLKVESFLKFLYKQKNIDPIPFSSFVVFETIEQYHYSHLCYKVMNVWKNDCATNFGLNLDTLYNRLEKVKGEIDNLSNLSKIDFSLIISIADDRKDKAIEFLQNREIIIKKIESLNSLKELRERFLNSKQSSQHSGLARSLKQTQQRVSSNLAKPALNTPKIARPFTSMNSINNKKPIQSPINRPLTTLNKPINEIKDQTILLDKVNDKQASRPSTSLTTKTKVLTESQKEYMILENTKNDDFDAQIESEKLALEDIAIKFYHYIWERSIEIRDLNYKLIDQFVVNSPLKILKIIMDDSEKTVFTSLIMRYFIIDWFIKNDIPILKSHEPIQLESKPIEEIDFSPIKSPAKPKSPISTSKLNLLPTFSEESLAIETIQIEELPDPTFPEFDPNNLKQICQLMSIPFIKNTQDQTTQSALALENAYLMTPDNRYCSQSMDQLNANSNKFDFPEIISFEHPPTCATTPIASNRHTCRDTIELDSLIDDEEEFCEEEEIKEKLFYKFHFPEKRHTNITKPLRIDQLLPQTHLTANQLDSKAEINKTIQSSNDLYSKSNNQIEPNCKANQNNKLQLINKNIKQNPENNLSASNLNEIQLNTSQLNETELNPNRSDFHKLFQTSKRHPQKKKEKTRDDYLINFFDYICSELTDPILKPEADVMRQFFVHFISMKSIINSKLDEKVKLLKAELKEMITEKCTHEMENFSFKFRKLKDHIFDLNYKIELSRINQEVEFTPNENSTLEASHDNTLENDNKNQSNSTEIISHSDENNQESNENKTNLDNSSPKVDSNENVNVIETSNESNSSGKVNANENQQSIETTINSDSSQKVDSNNNVNSVENSTETNPSEKVNMNENQNSAVNDNVETNKENSSKNVELDDNQKSNENNSNQITLDEKVIENNQMTISNETNNASPELKDNKLTTDNAVSNQQSNEIDEDDNLLFSYDTRYMNENLRQLYQRINGEFSLPSFLDNLVNQKMKVQYHVDENKLKSLCDCFSDKTFVSLDELNEKMELMNFDEKEKAFMIINALLKTIPEYINIIPFIESLTNK